MTTVVGFAEFRGWPPVISFWFHRAPHQVFDFGEDVLDRIQVRAVGRQKHQMRGSRIILRTAFPLRPAEIIQHDDVSRFQGFEKFLPDISLEGLAVNWPIEHPWCIRSRRSAARKIIVFQWLYGTWAMSHMETF